MIETIDNQETWLAQKLPRIGSSDARALLGCGYDGEGEVSVYDRMVHGIKKSFSPEQLELMREGSLIEGAILKLFAAKNAQYEIHPTEGFQLTTNPKYPDLCCTLDCVAQKRDSSEKFVIEAKFEQNGNREDYDDNQVPLKHYLQVQHQLIVTGWSGGFLVSLLRGRYVQRWIDRNEELIEQMLLVYADFMDKVRRRERPDGGPKLQYATAQAKADRQTAKYIGKVASEAVREAIRVQDQIRLLEKRIASLRKTVVDYAAGCEFVVMDDQRVVKLGRSGLELRPKLPPGVKVSV